MGDFTLASFLYKFCDSLGGHDESLVGTNAHAYSDDSWTELGAVMV